MFHVWTWFISLFKMWNSVKHHLAQTNNDRQSTKLRTAYQIHMKVSWRHLFSFSLWLNKHTVFLATRCWLIVQEDSFPPGGAGSAAVPSLRVWKWRWQDVDEEARSVTSNRRALECSTLLAGNEPVRLRSAHLSPSHPVILHQPHFHPRDAETGKHIQSVQYSVLTIRCVVCLPTNNNTFRMPPESVELLIWSTWI